MRWKTGISTLLVAATLLGCSTLPAGAADVRNTSEFIIEADWLRATSEFSTKIASGKSAVTRNELPLESGETVRINASYTPDGSVDFGLVDEDGKFYYINVQNGSIDQTIRISRRGNYKLKIRNNTSGTVSVTGYVRY